LILAAPPAFRRGDEQIVIGQSSRIQQSGILAKVFGTGVVGLVGQDGPRPVVHGGGDLDAGRSGAGGRSPGAAEQINRFHIILPVAISWITFRILHSQARTSFT
jgi:hypothetical protein